MSSANMQRFFEKVAQGGDTRQRAEAAAGVPLRTVVEMDLQQAEGHLDRLIAFAAKEGYAFTRDELVTAFRQQVAGAQKKPSGDELTDDNLASVAGGTGAYSADAVLAGFIGAIGTAHTGLAEPVGTQFPQLGSNAQYIVPKKMGNW